MNVKLPIRAEIRGMLRVGPVPGTPEFEEEQRCIREGIPYDYGNCPEMPFTASLPVEEARALGLLPPEPEPPPLVD